MARRLLGMISFPGTRAYRDLWTTDLIPRRREVESLRRGAAQLPQEAELLRRLHSLGDHAGAQLLRERDDGAHQLRRLAARRATGEQRSVDLQRIERESI